MSKLTTTRAIYIQQNGEYRFVIQDSTEDSNDVDILYQEKDDGKFFSMQVFRSISPQIWEAIKDAVEEVFDNKGEKY